MQLRFTLSEVVIGALKSPPLPSATSFPGKKKKKRKAVHCHVIIISLGGHGNIISDITQLDSSSLLIGVKS